MSVKYNALDQFLTMWYNTAPAANNLYYIVQLLYW
jgi:hypothetical protein